jgi:CHAT domain-containing protein
MRIFLTVFSTYLLIFSSNLFGQSQTRLPKDFQSKLLVYEPIFDNSTLINPDCSADIPVIIDVILKGDSLFLNGESAKACEQYKRGFQLSDKNKLRWHQVIFLNRLGFVNYWVASISKSYGYYKEAQKLISTCDQKTDSLAIIETTFFCDLLNPLNANIDGPKLLQLIDSLDSEIYYSSRLTKFYYLLVEINRQTRKFTEVQSELSKMRKAVDHCNNFNQAFWLFVERYEESFYYNIININQIANNFQQELVKQVNLQHQFNELSFNVKYKLAESCYYIGQYQMAIDLLKELQPIVERDRHPFFCSYYLSLGYSYYIIGDSIQPDILFKKAEKLLADYKIGDYRLANLYHFMSAYNYKVNFTSSLSLDYSLKALNILKYSPNEYLERYIYFRIGDYCYFKEDFLQAAKYYSYLLTDIDSLLDNELYFKRQIPKLLLNNIPNILYWRANSYYLHAKRHNFDINSLKKANDDFTKLTRLWIKIFNYLENFEEYKVDILKSIRDSYNSYIDVGFAYYNATRNKDWLDKMFILSQGSKVFLLNSYLNDRIAQKIAGIPEDSIQKSYKIKKELDELQYSQFPSVSGPNSGIGNDFLMSSIIEKYQQYDAYISQLEKEYPVYRLQKKKDHGISRKEIQERLKDDQALIEYYTAFDGFFTFYIDKKNFKVKYYKIPDNISEVSDKCKRYYELLSQISDTKGTLDRKKELYRLSNWFYQLLIAPIDNDIKGKRLIIVPDLELHMIPFETLISEMPSEQKIKTNATPSYLILKNPISYLYSSSQIGQNQDAVIRNAKYAGFVPDYSVCKDIRPINYYQGIGELPGALEEVTAANDYFRGKMYTGKRANKENFFTSLSRFDIVHLAMHTSIDTKEPMNSVLIFNPDSLQQEDQLRAYEVYSHENNAQMIVLSACNTAKGKLEKGEGVFSIARAFFLAGIPNVIMTQWSVSDKTSADLMERFYLFLSEGFPTDVAMQKAKIDLILKGDPVKKDPYFWSCYVSYGSATFLPLKSYVAISIIAGVLLLFIMVILIYNKKIRSKISSK